MDDEDLPVAKSPTTSAPIGAPAQDVVVQIDELELDRDTKQGRNLDFSKFLPDLLYKIRVLYKFEASGVDRNNGAVSSFTVHVPIGSRTDLLSLFVWFSPTFLFVT